MSSANSPAAIPPAIIAAIKVQVVGFGKTLVEIHSPVNAPIVRNAP